MTVLSNVLTHSHCQKTLSFKKKVGIFVLKFGIFVLKVGVFFKDLAIFFSKLGIFSGKGRLHHPSLSRLFPFHHSSLHFNQNMQTISLLRMTEYPLIFVSAVLVKPFQICLRRFPFLRMKGGWKGDDEVSTHCRNPINRVFQRLMKGERKKLSGWYGNFIIKMFQPFLNSSGKRDGWWISQGKIIVYGTFSG